MDNAVLDLNMSWDEVEDIDVTGNVVNSADGLILSLTNRGKVDIEYISQITGLPYKQIISDLKGAIYQNPLKWNEVFYKGFETADEYLSGNVLSKWKEARKANLKYKGYFEDNVKALYDVLPQPLVQDDVYVTLGSPWVPTNVIEDFISHILGIEPVFIKNIEYRPNRVFHDVITGSWEITNKNYYSFSVNSKYTYGTEQMPALHIMEKTLNMKTIVVYAESVEEAKKAGHPRQIHKEHTAQALNVQNRMIKEFQRWVWKDEKRAEQLLTTYEENYGGRKGRHYDGSFLTFPGMNPEYSLFPYQKNAVARIMFSPNTLLAHDVGSGKTYVMIAAGMELRRMGISKKNLYVVPNNILNQWETIFKELYPDAYILVVGPKQFTPKKREAVLKRIRDEKFDGIIMAYSCFDMISVSDETNEDMLRQSLEKIKNESNKHKGMTKQLRAKEQLIKKKLLELDFKKKQNLISIEDLGITRLFVDEAHNYKNVKIDTKVDKVLGLSTKGSQKSNDMMDKVKVIQKNNNGGGVVLATGTPITNSLTEAYIFQCYLQSGALELMDLQNFDSWIGMFAERVTEFEVDVDTSNFRMATRFSKFHNLPELTAMLTEVADFHRVSSEDQNLPAFNGYTDEKIEKTPSFEEFLKDISNRADRIRHGSVSRTEDNMLLITTDGRKAALDMRLVNQSEPFTCECKAYNVAEQAYKVYKNTEAMKGTQLIFCDSSTPKAGFNLYDDVKTHLVDMGIPENEIEYIHNATTDTAKEILFEAVRQGEIRILIGSTFKLGLGVNVQDRLVAIHHLDVPWRPADMVQREGRILRQGNLNKEIFIFRYITKGSFDAYSWQLLETKQRFISNLLSGTLEERNGADVDDTVLSYGEVKALAVGNDLVKRRVELQNEIQKTQILFHKYEENRTKMEIELANIPKIIRKKYDLINNLKRDNNLKNAWEPKSRYIKLTKEEQALLVKERKELAAKIHEKLKERIEAVADKNDIGFIAEYKSFNIYVPRIVKPDNLHIILRHKTNNFDHEVKLGDSVDGYIRRIDNYLDNIDTLISKTVENINSLFDREKQLERELANTIDYQEEIESLKKMLAAIDNELGVEKHE